MGDGRFSQVGATEEQHRASTAFPPDRRVLPSFLARPSAFSARSRSDLLFFTIFTSFTLPSPVTLLAKGIKRLAEEMNNVSSPLFFA